MKKLADHLVEQNKFGPAVFRQPQQIEVTLHFRGRVLDEARLFRIDLFHRAAGRDQVNLHGMYCMDRIIT